MIGDDFDVTKWNFATFPINADAISLGQRAELLELSLALDQAMSRNVTFKLNAGKKVGNHNLARCRDVTDQSDRIFAAAFGLSHVWEDIELMYAQVVKTDFSTPDADAGEDDS